ncbi:MAG: hypothetical protein AAF547_24360 [Actinomycetota bacterium]
MIVDSLTIDRAAFEAGTGWELKPEGACKGDICIPLAEPPSGDRVQVDALADQMGLAIVADEANGIWSIGPDSVGSRTLVTAEAPPLTLPDLDGNPFELSSLRGRKVLMVAWSPY